MFISHLSVTAASIATFLNLQGKVRGQLNLNAILVCVKILKKWNETINFLPDSNLFIHIVYAYNPQSIYAVIKPKNLGFQSKVAEFVYHIITNYQLKTIRIVSRDEAPTDLIEQCS